MPAGLIARVTSNLYKEKAAQLSSQPSPPPSPPGAAPAYDQVAAPKAAYLQQQPSSPPPHAAAAGSYDPYSSQPTLVLPSDPADTLQFQALSLDRPPSPSIAQPAAAVFPAPGKQHMQHRCVSRPRSPALARRSYPPASCCFRRADQPVAFSFLRAISPPSRLPSSPTSPPSLPPCLSSDPYNSIPSGLPARPPATPTSSSNGSIGSGSSYHSGPQQTADRNLSAALRGEYQPSKPPAASSSSHAHSGYGTYAEPMSSVEQHHPQPSPSYDSSAPPVPATAHAPTPASIAADQAAVAQAALRQAEQNARVAQIHAAAVAKTNAASGGNGSGEIVKIRKTAGKYALKDFEVARTCVSPAPLSCCCAMLSRLLETDPGMLSSLRPRRLGTGSFGRVHLVKSRHNGRFYAVKVLGKEKVVRMKQVEHTNSEREMLVRVRHPFLVNLWGTFADARNLYMVMDFVAGGELFSLLRKSQVRPSCLRPTGCLRRRTDLTPPLLASPPAALPQLGRQVLRGRGRARDRLPALARHHLPRPQAGKHPARR